MKPLVAAAFLAAILCAGSAYADAAANRTAIDDENGYKRMTVADLLLDAGTLAKEQRKISLSGIYIHYAKTDWLYPNDVPPQNRDESNGIPLLIDTASREFRSFLMSAWNHTRAEFGIHGTIILGRVSMCERQKVYENERMPCVIVDDGWNPRAEQTMGQAAREQAARDYEAAAPARAAHAAEAAREAAQQEIAYAERRRTERVLHYNECMNLNARLHANDPPPFLHKRRFVTDSMTEWTEHPAYDPASDRGACENYANANEGFAIGTAFEHPN